MDAFQIREHMNVVGADGRHMGTVDRVKGNRIKLARSDSKDGEHHHIEVSDVDAVKNKEVYLSKVARRN